MKKGQKSQSRIRHQRSVGRYHSPYQQGGTIFRDPPDPWRMSTYKPYEIDPWILKRVRKQRGGKLHTVVYPWKNKGRKRINRRRKRR